LFVFFVPIDCYHSCSKACCCYEIHRVFVLGEFYWDPQSKVDWWIKGRWCICIQAGVQWPVYLFSVISTIIQADEHLWWLWAPCFEVGPVFRAEKSNTHMHLCEFIGLDVEMEIKEHYFEVCDIIDGLFVAIFKHLNENCQKELAAINTQCPFEHMKHTNKA
uniref:Aminoacyl-tRNA synthetase class II (D/K/N) domain-containing protein n=1 Tax=Aegilops tauschii subsp. strangulata TaxID=200361 RepID=A0A453G9K2_AEGTS